MQTKRRTSEIVGELFLSICVAGGRKGVGKIVEVEGFHGERKERNDDDDGDNAFPSLLTIRMVT